MDYPEDGIVEGPPPDGTMIEKVLEHVVEVAELHAVLTSPRRQYLRRRLLQSLRSTMTIEEIEGLRTEFGAQEYERHINKFLRWGLVKPVKSGEDVTGYVRTSLGEEGLNIVRELQRKVGEERARSIAEAGLGSNAIKLSDRWITSFQSFAREAFLRSCRVVCSFFATSMSNSPLTICSSGLSMDMGWPIHATLPLRSRMKVVGMPFCPAAFM